eukprot:gene3273-3755_t
MDKNGNKEYQSVTDNLRKLRGLSEDEISEEGLLKSRIEQQSELICILKQRADEYLKKYMEIESRTENLRADLEKANQRVEDEKHEKDVLRKRFDVLDNNHLEMINLKDEFKSDNERLRKENEKLIFDNNNLFSASIEEKNATLKELNTQVADFKVKLKQAEERAKSIVDELENTKQESEKAIRELKIDLDKEKASQKEVVEELKKSYSTTFQQLSDAQKLFAERDKQCKSLEEKSKVQADLIMEQESKQGELKTLLSKERERARQLELKAKKDAEYLNTNSTIRRLNKEIEQAQHFNAKIIREFDAYKKHSSDLLSKEKELNSKLRRYNIK